MISYLDSLPFNWADPAAQELRDFLASTYYRVDQLVPILQQSGVPPAAVALDRPMFQVWHNAIEVARNRDRLRILLDNITKGADAAVANRIQELTAAAPIVSADHGTPAALLAKARTWQGFDDRKALERLTFDDDTLLDVAFLERGLQVAPAIARFLVTFPPQRRFNGTGFRIADDVLLTNHHVLFDWERTAEPAIAAEAWFGYERDFAGRQREWSKVECNPATIAGDRNLDWAVIRTSATIPAGTPVLGLNPERAAAVNDRVYIIQHPDGGPKQIGMHHNIVRYVDDTVIQYWTDTKGGSSGSPVFNERWEVVGLHHRWLEAQREGEREYRNEGIRIERVRDSMVAAGLP